MMLREMKTLGLRIGATNTHAAVASLSEPSARAVSFAFGAGSIPTAVAQLDGHWLVGEPARRALLSYDASSLVARLNVEEQDGPAAGDGASRQDLMCALVREVKRRAEAQFGGPVQRCVLSMPYYITPVRLRTLCRAVSSEFELVEFTISAFEVCDHPVELCVCQHSR